MLSFIKFLAFVSWVVFWVIAGWFTYVYTVLDSCADLSPVYNGANCSLQIEILLFVIWCNLLPVCDSACRIKEVQMCRQTSLHQQTFWCVWLLARTICACLAMKSRIYNISHFCTACPTTSYHLSLACCVCQQDDSCREAMWTGT